MRWFFGSMEFFISVGLFEKKEKTVEIYRHRDGQLHPCTSQPSGKPY